MTRRILAAVAGYILFVVATLALFTLSGRDPHAPQGATFVVLSTIYGIIFAAVGGFVAAKLSGTSPRYEGKLVGAAIAVGAVVSISQNEPPGLAWSQIAAIALMAPAAVVGGRIVSQRVSADPGAHGRANEPKEK